MDNLEEKLKEQIVEQLNLEDVDPQEINDSDPLFGDDGLGLDSIDALELIVLLNEGYDLSIPNPEDGSKILRSVETMAEFIREHAYVKNQ